MDISVTTLKDGQQTEARKYRVLSKGQHGRHDHRAASERGQIMLMKDRDLWVFLPDVSQPVRLSLAQRLTGQVSNGDLARANFAGDYNPTILRTDTIHGEPYYVLELTAVDRGVTYHRVLYWVKQSNNFPHRAEFYSLSNRLLKLCVYESPKRMLGIMRPSRLVMQDALRKGEGVRTGI